ncbi:SGNH/GDSL hydrolase family protein [uncultured Draconibacterium sp.]|uniref:SGNH/GDSL hydrolase family protein n=1 Tax=uncultured Draconibacterium sp. TaxID=1573823 RepID=UPI003217DBC1
MNKSRRNFIRKTGMAGMAALTAPGLLSASKTIKSVLQNGGKSGLTILFQGDSITDGNRTRNDDWNHVMGHGYQFILSSKYWFEYPEKKFMFYNRGISGNRVRDLEARWQQDALDLKPDVLSILVGINDVEATIWNRDPEPIEKFEAHYRSILNQTKNALPEIQIVLCEPFCLPVGRVADKLETYQHEIQKQQTVIRKLAKEFDAVYVELQKPFTEACKKAPANYWIWDGIHPMPAGHELIAREWNKKVAGVLTDN